MTTPPAHIRAQAAAAGVVPALTPEPEALRRILGSAISYEVPVSIVVEPSEKRQTIRRTFRTDADAEELLDALTPIVTDLLDTHHAEVIALLERRSRWSAAAAGRILTWPRGWSRRERRDNLRELATQSAVLSDFAAVLRAQPRRWWLPAGTGPAGPTTEASCG